MATMNSHVNMPTAPQITDIVKHLLVEGKDIGVAVGVASPDFSTPGFFFNGNLVSRSHHQALTFDENTLFAIGSVSKTYTATLFAAAVQNNGAVAQSILGSYPIDGTTVGSNFENIQLVTLANYTSGLPADNTNGPVEVPPDQKPKGDDVLWIPCESPQSLASAALGLALRTVARLTRAPSGQRRA